MRRALIIIVGLLVVSGLATAGWLWHQQNDSVSSLDDLVIASPYTVTSLDPMQYDAVNRTVLMNMYEGLVRTDRNLSIESALAVSWGSLDDHTWEFRLRPGVVFHDGSSVTADDVKASFERAKEGSSQVRTLVSGITAIQVDGDTLQFSLAQPDPVFLQKIAGIFITKDDPSQTVSDFGTGPYQFSAWDTDDVSITLDRFDQYWGLIPSFPAVTFRTISDPDERQEGFTQGTIDLYVDLAPSSVKGVPSFITVRALPSLEVYFLAFNMRNTSDNPFANKSLRQAIQQALDLDAFVSLSNGYARVVSQFVSSGIFGYDSTIQLPVYDLEGAKDLVRSASHFTRVAVTLDLPSGLEQFGFYVQEQLSLIGIDVSLNVLSSEQMLAKITAGTSDFYFFGWRSELGDASDFLSSVVHSSTEDGEYGSYNGGRYSSATIDALIESALHDIHPDSRLASMQEVMRTIVVDDLIGVPLFEADVLYGVSPEISWEPRIDGYVMVSDITPASSS